MLTGSKVKIDAAVKKNEQEHKQQNLSGEHIRHFLHKICSFTL